MDPKGREKILRTVFSSGGGGGACMFPLQNSVSDRRPAESDAALPDVGGARARRSIRRFDCRPVMKQNLAFPVSALARRRIGPSTNLVGRRLWNLL